MKKLILIAVIGILHVAPILADAPWSDYGCFSAGSDYSDLSNPFFNIADTVHTHYTALYGEAPNKMLWQDVDPNPSLRFRVDYRYPSRYDWPEPDWNDSTLTWGELRQHLILRMTRVGSNDTANVTITWSDPNTVVTDPSFDLGWHTSFEVPLNDLSIDDFTRSWKLWVEPIGMPPSFCLEGGHPAIDTLVIARRVRSTPMDTLLWAMEDWSERVSPELASQLLNTFPNNVKLLQELLLYYYYAENCDSTTRIGNYLIEVLNNINLDPFLWVTYPEEPGSPNQYEAAKLIKYLCEDGNIWQDWKESRQ